MTVDLLSSIKDAKPSKVVNELFDIILKSELPSDSSSFYKSDINSVHLSLLRDDVVKDCSSKEKQIIIENFPKEKNGYLVVSKVIEE